VKTIILIEPICRGSRLQILANTLYALRRCAKVVLITRRDYKNNHFTELITSQNLEPEIVVANTDLSGAWMKSLNLSEFQCIIEALKKTLNKLSNNKKI